MRMLTCCFSGHRDIPAGELPALEKRLREAVEALIGQGVRYFGAGGARGFDTLAARVVLDWKVKYPHIRLILVLPCPEQTRGWRKEDVRLYQEVLGGADKIVYTAKEYASGCMQRRDRHLVESSGVCLCYLTRKTGGTAYTVNYARRRGLRIMNLACTGD